VPEATPPTFLNQRVAKLVPKSDVHPEYLIQCLRSRLFLDQIYSKAAGSKQANVSNKDIYSTLTPLPPLKEQQEIAAQLDRFERARSDVADATRCSTLLLAVLNNTLV
jgi:type I restriction enzyme S subunit